MVIYLLQNCQANERKSALIEFSPNALALIFSLTQSKRHEKNKSVAYWMMYELNVWRCSMMHLMFEGEKEQEVERERERIKYERMQTICHQNWAAHSLVTFL